MDKKNYNRQRNRVVRRPDKNCLRCGHAGKKALRVAGRTRQQKKVVLCLNCIEELKG